MYSQWRGGVCVTLATGREEFSRSSWGAISSSRDGEVPLVAFWRRNEEDESLVKATTEVV